MIKDKGQPFPGISAVMSKGVTHTGFPFGIGVGTHTGRFDSSKPNYSSMPKTETTVAMVSTFPMLSLLCADDGAAGCTKSSFQRLIPAFQSLYVLMSGYIPGFHFALPLVFRSTEGKVGKELPTSEAIMVGLLTRGPTARLFPFHAHVRFQFLPNANEDASTNDFTGLSWQLCDDLPRDLRSLPPCSCPLGLKHFRAACRETVAAIRPELFDIVVGHFLDHMAMPLKNVLDPRFFHNAQTPNPYHAWALEALE